MSKKIKLHYGLLLLLICLISCQEKTEAQKKTSIISETTIDIKKRVLDDQTVQENELWSGTPLSEQQQDQLSLNKIDDAQKRIKDYLDIQYYCVDTIFENGYGKVLLISRHYEMEDYAWLVIYDSKMNLKDYKTVFYDEYAESVHHIYAKFENPHILLTEYKMNLNDGTEQTDTMYFAISNKLEFSKGLLTPKGPR